MEETAKLNFVSSVPDSHFYSDLAQIKITLEHMISGASNSTSKYVLCGINNTIKHGYKIVPPATPLVKGDYAIYMKGKKPVLVKIRVITKTGIYHVKRQDTGMIERITDSSKLTKFTHPL